MNNLVIINGDIVVGDGKNVLKKTSVIVEDHLIVDLLKGTPDRGLINRADKLIDAEGKIVIPGIINSHTHGVTSAPLFPSCASPLSQDQIVQNLNRHLLEGTTTLLNVDGFATMDEVEAINGMHPINIKTATSHTQWNLKAADAVDGSGLQDIHRMTSVEEMLEDGAVAIGEIGAGHTLGGGGQDYLYIPLAIKRETDIDISERQARALKRAVLGRYVDPSAYDAEDVLKVLKDIGLSDKLEPETAKRIIIDTVIPPVQFALEGLREAGRLAMELDVPVIVHNSAPSKTTVVELADQGLGSRLIAAHSNHTTFTMQEAIDHAKELKNWETWIDLSTYGSFQSDDIEDIKKQFALLKEGVVDIVTTDYGGGNHDPMLFVLEQAIQRNIISLPYAISLVTYNVTEAIPLLAPNRGKVSKGKVADLVLIGEDSTSKVDTVIIGGNVVVEQGRLLET